ncbi:pyruvate dehydrogenase (acetyl-transferring), homodimeric type [Chloracidobacterium thermophilum]|uniref:pyruvate dehydrogenase (acetyl-transferring), homodimeric type n=1 Tax=Chloracidobacterium thermophilum TaxID=458033 RepID=UPI000738A02F|nr:pyruvate dehydrogenase (acetyl-transferring), homodimeric type [Chloracidobacterium thermophilum]
MYLDEFKQQLPDADPQETAEWLEALEQVVNQEGRERAQFLLRKLLKKSRLMRVGLPELVQTPYINTISPEQEPPFPGDEEMELRIRRIVRWNAVAMVVRANHYFPGIGGHLATYASSASLYEVGFNHFFQGKDGEGAGDQIFYQGHAAPGIYSRAFLEGRLTVEHLEHFRREALGKGLSSYPHPRLMPDFWEFPTVSMGLGPINAIYQARFNRYLHNRGIADTSRSRVWAFLGDGETDEPEALGALHLAAREGLDNLVFVVNCNLQRLDGPVRGNGKIIQELEAVFRGAGWNVIKVIWSRRWDPLLAKDTEGALLHIMNTTLDGEFQKYSVESGAYIRRHFFGKDPRTLAMVEPMSDRDLERLRRGGHDHLKIYAAYKAAVEHQGQPTVILVKTVKGWMLGESATGRNATHQLKKLTEAELRKFRDLMALPIPDAQVGDAPYYHPGEKSPEVEYLRECRRRLGGELPRRVVRSKPLELPREDLYAEFAAANQQPVSTTMAIVRLLRKLLDDKHIGRRIVPIIPDEARTFGMDFLFKKVGIYSAKGQLYDPVDSDLLFSYREAKDGQLLEEGITEAGAMGSFTAASTSYATHGEPVIPFYMFYSMFGFQRTGDQSWAVGDARGRGFLIGATAGRTTLNGEGLQHQDGHSHVLASTVPCCVQYDPAFHFEIATIVRDGLRRMYEQGEDVFYYITVYNENYAMPAMPRGVEEGILRGLYLFKPCLDAKRHIVQIFGSGAIMMQALEAQRILAERYDVAADVWSATSYRALRDDALQAEAWNLAHPLEKPRVPYLQKVLANAEGPIIAVSDYMKAWPDSIARWVRQPFLPLGTDGFGMSDTREQLRRHFKVDAASIAYAALYKLAEMGKLGFDEVARAGAELYGEAPVPEPVAGR